MRAYSLVDVTFKARVLSSNHLLLYDREEGKVSRKLIECINTYLLKDGPNLDCQNLEIHDAVQPFVFRCWVTTHDRILKVCYAFHRDICY